jgi:ATP-binding cassette subfamily B protein
MKEKYILFRKSLQLVWKSAPGWTSATVFISIMRSTFPLALLWLIKVVIDSVTSAASQSPGTVIVNVLWPVTALAIVWFLDEASADVDTFVRKKQSLKLELYMYQLLHAKAVKLDLINFELPEYFDCLSRASREAPWRPNNILNNLIAMFRAFLSLILITGLILTLHWTIALLLLLVNIPGIWLRLHYADILYNFQRKQTPEARKSTYYHWLLTGERPSRELRLFGLGKYFTSLFEKSLKRQKEEEINIIRKRTSIELISTLSKATAIFITLFIISGKTIKGNLSIGQMAMFLMALRQGMSYIKELLSSLAGLYEDSLFIGDTFEFLNLEEKIRAVEPVVIPSPVMKNIVVKNLTFTYPGNTTGTITDVSFEIKKGEVIALVGPNGSGKSTLVKLLCRLYDPDSGCVKYDGSDIRNMDPEKYRKLFSVVFQDFMLYNLKAGENIRMGDIEESDADDKIRSAAMKIGIHSTINSLPKGYDTMLGNLFDESRELSWGEWQKIAIARALFRDAPVLILDEPSSSLDADTEYDIFSQFRKIVKDRTSILISHRFTNVSLADRIIVLDKGAIVETGTHEELMVRKGIYFSMFTKQSSRFGK